MRLADKDLNIFYPISKRTKIVLECNHALEVVDRLENQIKIWSLKPLTDVNVQIMKDELNYLKEGKI